MEKVKHYYDITNLRLNDMEKIEYLHRNLFIYRIGNKVYLVEEVELE